MITKFSEEQSKQFKEFLQNYNNWNSNEVDEVLENLMDLEEKFMEELILLPNFPKLIQDAIDNGSSIILITEKWVILDDITSELYDKIDSLDLFPYWGHGYTHKFLLETYKNIIYETNN
jgi:hypothetical protein